jgi:UDP-N-acetylglucosamine--N-acetylmuramyl-(pentapeptide) pyrophosphoryl-undecaprenol N-acetylglucosamine transferase
MTTYMLLGGGTAGHVNPLLATAEYIRSLEPESEIVIVGTAEGLEARLVPARGFSLETIDRLPLPRRLNGAALKFPWKFRNAVLQLRNLIRRHSVDVVVGFGGYASAPGYVAARREHVPLVVHEANAKPGIANRMAAKSTPFVGVAFASTPIANAHLVGMPLRAEIATLNRERSRSAAYEFFGLDPNRRTLVVTGGSQGARSINLAVSSSAHMITETGWQILHIWGQLTEISAVSIPNYHVVDYCDRMDLALAVADFTISRAGSATVSELSGLGIPSVFVPYPVGNGEQRFNAQGVVSAGGALFVEDAQLNPELIRENILALMNDPGRLQQMSQRALTVGTLDGTEKLLALIRKAQHSRGTVKG